MQIKAISLLIVLCLPGLISVGAAHAAETEAHSVTVHRADCMRAIGHVPSAGVVYREGIDVRGNDVTPADVDSNAYARNLDVIVFTLRYQPLLDEEELELSNIPLGEVRVDSQGRAYLNGEPMTNNEESWLQERCREALDD